MLLARSAPECRLYIDLHPCVCGATLFDVRHHLRSEPDGSLAAVYGGDCPQCGLPRLFVFTLDPATPPAPPAFGGPAASRIICPGQFALVSDDASRRAHADPAGLSPTDHRASRANLELALAAIEEVVKFIPAGADAVPPEAFTSIEGQRLYASEPQRFRRYRLEAVADAYRQLIDAHTAPR
jgi:hypothetical protein